MVEPEQTSIAEQRLGNQFSVTTNSSERVVARWQVAKHKIHVTTSELTHGFRDNTFLKNSNGTFGGGDFYSGRVASIKREFIRE
jgi:hypothetical protein